MFTISAITTAVDNFDQSVAFVEHMTVCIVNDYGDIENAIADVNRKLNWEIEKRNNNYYFMKPKGDDELTYHSKLVVESAYIFKG